MQLRPRTTCLACEVSLLADDEVFCRKCSTQPFPPTVGCRCGPQGDMCDACERSAEAYERQEWRKHMAANRFDWAKSGTPPQDHMDLRRPSYVGVKYTESRGSDRTRDALVDVRYYRTVTDLHYQLHDDNYTNRKCPITFHQAAIS